MKNYKFLIFIFLLVLNLLFFAFISIYIIKEQNYIKNELNKNEINNTNEIKTLSIGEKILLDNITYTVNGLKLSLGNEFEKPKKGFVFYLVDLTIQNNDNKINTIDTKKYLKLFNSSKTQTFNQAIYSGQEKCLNSDILPGKSIRGEITFEVPLPKTLFNINTINAKNQIYFNLTNAE
jgi:uncharacterized protein YneF (UPF0154 family)